MGDMADFAIEQELEANIADGLAHYDMSHGRRRYPSNYASDEEDEDSYAPSYRRTSNRRACKFCGLGDLHWGITDRGWRLFNELDEMHTCVSANPRAPAAVSCKRCGKPGLKWVNTGEGWRLTEFTGTIHRCTYMRT